MEHLDWKALLEQIVMVVLNFGSGAIPTILITYLLDRLFKIAPWLSPYRELIKQWVLGQVDQIKLERTQAVVLAGEQMYNSSQNVATQNGDTISLSLKQSLRDTRNRRVLEAISNRRITQHATEAKLLIEHAVSNLKKEGRL